MFAVVGSRSTKNMLRLTCWHEEGVEHADALRQHSNLQAHLLFEVLHELGQGHLLAVLVIDGEAVPQGPRLAIVLLTGCLDGFTEGKERQCQVSKTVLEDFKAFVALDKLDQFEADKTCNQRSGGGDSWNDPSGNLKVNNKNPQLQNKTH